MNILTDMFCFCCTENFGKIKIDARTDVIPIVTCGMKMLVKTCDTLLVIKMR